MNLLLQLKLFEKKIQSLTTEDDLNDASKQKNSEKIHRWDQSLPCRCKETTRRIQIALKRKEVGMEETNNNNEYTIESIFYVHLFSR